MDPLRAIYLEEFGYRIKQLVRSVESELGIDAAGQICLALAKALSEVEKLQKLGK